MYERIGNELEFLFSERELNLSWVACLHPSEDAYFLFSSLFFVLTVGFSLSLISLFFFSHIPKWNYFTLKKIALNLSPQTSSGLLLRRYMKSGGTWLINSWSSLNETWNKRSFESILFTLYAAVNTRCNTDPPFLFFFFT